MKNYRINKEKCAGCGACIKFCPNQAIKIDNDGKVVIDYKKCQGCGACIRACPFNAIEEILNEDRR